MKERIITGTILLSILVPIFLIDFLFPLFLVVIVFLTGIGTYEFLRMYKKEKAIGKAQMIFTIILSIIALAIETVAFANVMMLEEYKITLFQYDFGFIFLLIIITVYSLMVFVPDFDGRDAGRSFLAILFIGVGMASITTLRMMGVRFIIYLFLITIMTDMFAYFFGVKFGKHKMAPHISPKKSWEGAIAGTVFGTLFGSLFGTFYGVFPEIVNKHGHQTLLESFSSIGTESLWLQAALIIIISLIASIMGQIGDLVASKFKRTYEIKDFGTIFPGHGGVVDRFDSAMFVGMFLVFVFRIVFLIFPV